MSLGNILRRASRHAGRPSKTPAAKVGDRNSRRAATVWLPTVSDVLDVGRLVQIFRDGQQNAGRAPGRDGLRWDDLGPGEAANVFRALRIVAFQGDYRPQPERPQYVPRPGKSPRRLDIGSIVDRVVAASLAGLMAPAVDRALGPHAFAYRAGTGHLDMLARLATIAHMENRWVVVNSDVAAAFPSVPLAGVMEAHRRLVAGLRQRVPGPGGGRRGRARRADHRRHGDDGVEKLLNLIETMTVGAVYRERGLSQGNPYSPTAMEVYMDMVLDAPTRLDPTNPPRLRYSDNVVSLAGSVPEGRLDRDRCQALLQPHGRW